jgi:hypothetical protein
MNYSELHHNVWKFAEKKARRVSMKEVHTLFENMIPVVEELPIPEGALRDQIEFRFQMATLFSEGLHSSESEQLTVKERREFESLFRSQVVALMSHFAILAYIVGEELSETTGSTE